MKENAILYTCFSLFMMSAFTVCVVIPMINFVPALKAATCETYKTYNLCEKIVPSTLQSIDNITNSIENIKRNGLEQLSPDIEDLQKMFADLKN